MERRALLKICIIIIFPSLPLFPQNNHNTIFTYVYNISNGEVSSYNGLVSTALEIEIERVGFNPVVMSKPPQIDASFSSLTEAEQQITEAIQTFKVDDNTRYAAVCLFSAKEGKTIDLRYLLYDLKARRPLAQVEEQASIDLNLDSVLYRGARKLIVQAEIEPVEIVESPVEIGEEEKTAATSEQSLPTDIGMEESDQGERVKQQTGDSGATQAESRTSVPETSPESSRIVTEPVQEVGIEYIQPGKSNRFNILAGFSPFLPSGAGTKYLSVGLQPRLSLGFRFHNPGNSLYIGLNIGFLMFQAKGTILTAQTYVAEVGPDLRYYIDFSRALNLFFLVSGGPAMYMLKADAIGFIYKLVPYGKAGLGLDIRFGKAFGMTFTFEYQIIFEGSVLLMGFSPGADIVLRL